MHNYSIAIFKKSGDFMRIVAGSLKGKKLEGTSSSKMRPTTDKVKEAVFSIIQFKIIGKKFLDLFAGSGQMGLEAISRGAKHAFLVDSQKSSIDFIRKNIKSCGCEDSTTVLFRDSVSFLKTTKEKFDIAFLDPPYETGLLEKTLPMLVHIMNDTGVIICECPFDSNIIENVGPFSLHKKYKYGKIAILVYLNEKEAEL